MPTDNEWLRLIYAAAATPPLATTGQLNAPNSASTQSFAGRSRVSCAYTISSFSANITARLEGQFIENGQWYNLAADGQDEVHTANGQHLLTWEGTAHAVRFNYLSGGGTITVTLRYD